MTDEQLLKLIEDRLFEIKELRKALKAFILWDERENNESQTVNDRYISMNLCRDAFAMARAALALSEEK